MKTEQKKVRILFAKPGLDGHDVGAKVVVRSLMEAGFDVSYTGLRKTPEEIVRRARAERVDVLGLFVQARREPDRIAEVETHRANRV